MHVREKKIINDSVLKRPVNRLLRLLGPEAGLQASLATPERKDQETWNGFQKEIGNSMLVFEYEKSKAIMTVQRNQKFC